MAADEDTRAKGAEHLRKSVRKNPSHNVVVCRPEDEADVREIVREAQVAMHVVADPKVHSFMSIPSLVIIEKECPALASQLPPAPPQKDPHGAPEIRIIVHHHERTRAIRIETGPEKTEIQLGE